MIYSGDFFVAELVHKLIMVERKNGESLAVTTDAEGNIIAVMNDYGMDMQDDLFPEEIAAIRHLTRNPRPLPPSD